MSDSAEQFVGRSGNNSQTFTPQYKNRLLLSVPVDWCNVTAVSASVNFSICIWRLWLALFSPDDSAPTVSADVIEALHLYFIFRCKLSRCYSNNDSKKKQVWFLIMTLPFSLLSYVKQVQRKKLNFIPEEQIQLLSNCFLSRNLKYKCNCPWDS